MVIIVVQLKNVPFVWKNLFQHLMSGNVSIERIDFKIDFFGCFYSRLRCLHLLHRRCLRRSIKHSNLCPICRKDILQTEPLKTTKPVAKRRSKHRVSSNLIRQSQDVGSDEPSQVYQFKQTEPNFLHFRFEHPNYLHRQEQFSFGQPNFLQEQEQFRSEQPTFWPDFLQLGFE